MAKAMGVAKKKAGRITGRQRVARVKNIEIARRSRKSGKKMTGESIAERMHRRKSVSSTESAVYLSTRARGKSKSFSRKMAIKAGKWTYKRLYG